ncbi:hypothetical protein IAT38_003134 [Cryptococcus sp. DSM 104549]
MMTNMLTAYDIRQHGEALCRAGEKIGPWVYRSVLGSGGQGCVLLAEHETTHQQAAIKVMVANSYARREALYLSLVDAHPNVGKMIEMYEGDPWFFLVLEYYPQSDLYTYAEENPNSGTHLVNVFAGITRALAYIHDRHVVHLDIKGDNILIGDDGEIRLADFGLAAWGGEGRMARGRRGTPVYMAPEVAAKSDSEFEGTKADIWSLGMLWWLLRLGELPYDRDEGDTATYTRVVTEELDLEANWKGKELDLMKGMLNRDPVKRFTIHQVITHPFFTDRFEPDSFVGIRAGNISPLPADISVNEGVVEELVGLAGGSRCGAYAEDIVDALRYGRPNTYRLAYALVLRRFDGEDYDSESESESETASDSASSLGEPASFQLAVVQGSLRNGQATTASQPASSTSGSSLADLDEVLEIGIAAHHGPPPSLLPPGLPVVQLPPTPVSPAPPSLAHSEFERSSDSASSPGAPAAIQLAQVESGSCDAQAVTASSSTSSLASSSLSDLDEALEIGVVIRQGPPFGLLPPGYKPPALPPTPVSPIPPSLAHASLIKGCSASSHPIASSLPGTSSLSSPVSRAVSITLGDISRDDQPAALVTHTQAQGNSAQKDHLLALPTPPTSPRTPDCLGLTTLALTPVPTGPLTPKAIAPTQLDEQATTPYSAPSRASSCSKDDSPIPESLLADLRTLRTQKVAGKKPEDSRVEGLRTAYRLLRDNKAVILAAMPEDHKTAIMATPVRRTGGRLAAMRYLLHGRPVDRGGCKRTEKTAVEKLNELAADKGNDQVNEGDGEAKKDASQDEHCARSNTLALMSATSCTSSVIARIPSAAVRVALPSTGLRGARDKTCVSGDDESVQHEHGREEEEKEEEEAQISAEAKDVGVFDESNGTTLVGASSRAPVDQLTTVKHATPGTGDEDEQGKAGTIQTVEQGAFEEEEAKESGGSSNTAKSNFARESVAPVNASEMSVAVGSQIEPLQTIAGAVSLTIGEATSVASPTVSTQEQTVPAVEHEPVEETKAREMSVEEGSAEEPLQTIEGFSPLVFEETDNATPTCSIYASAELVDNAHPSPLSHLIYSLTSSGSHAFSSPLSHRTPIAQQVSTSLVASHRTVSPPASNPALDHTPSVPTSQGWMPMASAEEVHYSSLLAVVAQIAQEENAESRLSVNHHGESKETLVSAGKTHKSCEASQETETMVRKSSKWLKMIGIKPKDKKASTKEVASEQAEKTLPALVKDSENQVGSKFKRLLGMQSKKGSLGRA